MKKLGFDFGLVLGKSDVPDYKFPFYKCREIIDKISHLYFCFPHSFMTIGDVVQSTIVYQNNNNNSKLTSIDVRSNDFETFKEMFEEIKNNNNNQSNLKVLQDQVKELNLNVNFQNVEFDKLILLITKYGFNRNIEKLSFKTMYELSSHMELKSFPNLMELHLLNIKVPNSDIIASLITEHLQLKILYIQFVQIQTPTHLNSVKPITTFDCILKALEKNGTLEIKIFHLKLQKETHSGSTTINNNTLKSLTIMDTHNNPQAIMLKLFSMWSGSSSIEETMVKFYCDLDTLSCLRDKIPNLKSLRIASYKLSSSSVELNNLDQIISLHNPSLKEILKSSPFRDFSKNRVIVNALKLNPYITRLNLPMEFNLFLEVLEFNHPTLVDFSTKLNSFSMISFTKSLLKNKTLQSLSVSIDLEVDNNRESYSDYILGIISILKGNHYIHSFSCTPPPKNHKQSISKELKFQLNQAIQGNYTIQLLNIKYNTQEIEPLTESKKDIILALIKQIKVGVEIKHMVLPCFLLQPRSTLESFSDMFTCLDELYKVNDIQDSTERYLQFLKFYLSGFHTTPRGIKKPFNPVIGEVFDCEWDNSEKAPEINIDTHENERDDSAHFEAEQISHHPPISAFCFYNKKRQILCNATVVPQYVKFYGNSCESHLNGVLVFHFLKLNESYTVTLPTLGVKGILIGKLSRFLNGKVHVKRVTPREDISAELEFLTKGIIGGSKNINGIKGHIDINGKTSMKIKGNWDNIVTYSRVIENDHKDVTLLNVHECKKYKMFTKPIDEQPYNSSYHLWQSVTKCIMAGDDQNTALEKQKIEQKQRIEEQERKDSGKKWIPEKFILQPHNSDYQNFYIYKGLSGIFPNHFKPQLINN
ncbi:oxysterol binding family protein [Tieghemostelium lacteum]|uniref:Oxysterol binding family protein n=1 Tax=Tieghemostelium lacteum TaxID=361077 RepID=A0A151Z483_TIELA|nr:oxysterol binding family protein [Tieghemostelium lacteum]|eukprot:KYQ88783.1 oxysterol binding family protein [Tieghemostelium lacteum]